MGNIYCYTPYNIYYKKVTSKDIIAKACKEEHLKLFNIFIVIGYNYCKMVIYDIPNKVGKITTKVYTRRILPTILEDLKN